ncbi:MAG: type II toxin-antitoxin system RelE/ParE family toxin [Planctomycetota bacterium]
MKIIWAGASISDMEAIRDHIGQDSEHYAARFVGRIVEAVGILERFPEIGQVVPEFEDVKIRQLIFQNYRILYQIRTDHLLILAVIHAGRDLSSLEPRPWNVS